MTSESSVPLVSIPDAWIEPRLSSSGFLPDVAVHRRGNTVIQEKSRSVLVLVVAMCVFGLLALVPIQRWGVVIPEELGFPYFAQVFVALGSFWGAICAAVGTTVIDNLYGVSVILDLQTQLICIREDEREITVPTSRVIGLQILRGPKGRGGYQLNLVFRRDSGEIARVSLYTNASRSYVMRLANSYHRFAGLPILETPRR